MFIPTLSWIVYCCCVVAAVVVFIVFVVVVNLPVLCGPEPGGHPLKAIPERKKIVLTSSLHFCVKYKLSGFTYCGYVPFGESSGPMQTGPPHSATI